ncbi:MAG: cytochrome c peroxidase, partial [Betaproteobacteria bacterium]
REFDGNAASVTRIFKRDPDLAACFRRVFRDSPLRDPQDTVVNVGKALAAFVETLVTGRTPFDEYRQVLAGRTDASAVAAYPPAAQRGLKLFVGEAQCVDCHKGPNFSDGRFHPSLSRDTVASAPAVSRTIGSPALDAGRLDGARELTKSPFNLLGLYNDDSSRANAVATSRLTARENMRGQFRTPSLRNVAVTAPYMHDGHLDDLREAIRHARPRPTRGNTAHTLTEQQVDDVAAFLVTLTDRYGERRPWVTASNVRCP